MCCRLLGVRIEDIARGYSVVEGMQSSRFQLFVGFLVGQDNLFNNAKLVQGAFSILFRYCGNEGFWDESVSTRFFNDVVNVNDKKEQQILSGLGGGSAIMKYFCCYCTCTNDKKGLRSLSTCVDCIRLQNTLPCFHTTFLTSCEVDRLKGLADSYGVAPQYNVFHRCVLRELKSTSKANETVAFCVRMFLITEGEAPSTTGVAAKKLILDWFSKYAIPSNSVFSADVVTIKQHLRARGFFTDGTLESRAPFFADLITETGRFDVEFAALAEGTDDWWRRIMRFVIVMGDHFEYLEDSNAKELRIMTKMETAMICGLHFELRVGQKLIKCLLEECHRYLSHDQFKARMQTCDRVFNECFTGGNFISDDLALGEIMAGDFRISVEQGHPVDFKTSMVKQRKVFARIDVLVEAVFFELPYRGETERAQLESRKEAWKAMLKSHEEVMEQVRKKEDFTPAMVDTFQAVADNFGRLYIALLGGEAVTNYVHDLIAGHFRVFLRRYGNIYRFANIGFESYIGVIRSYALRRTQRGGTSGDGEKTTFAQALGKKGVKDIAIISSAMLANGDKVLQSGIYSDMCLQGKNAKLLMKNGGIVKKRGRPCHAERLPAQIPEGDGIDLENLDGDAHQPVLEHNDGSESDASSENDSRSGYLLTLILVVMLTLILANRFVFSFN